MRVLVILLLSVSVVAQTYSWVQQSSAGGTVNVTWPHAGGFTMIWYDPTLGRTSMFYENNNNATIYENSLYLYDPILNNFTSIFGGSPPSTAWATSMNVAASSGNLCAPPAPTVAASGSGGPSAATYFVYITGTTNSSSVPPSIEYPMHNYTEQKTTTTNGQIITVHANSLQTQFASWNVYVGLTSGSETLQASGLAPAATWTMPGSGLVAGAALPIPPFPGDRQTTTSQGVYDTTRNRFWMYAGACNSAIKDFWYFDSAAWGSNKGSYTAFNPVNPGPVAFWTRQAEYGRDDAPAVNPGGQLDSTLAYIPVLTGAPHTNNNDDKIYMVGGDINASKTERYDPVANTWTNSANCSIGTRSGAMAIYASAQQKMYLFHGSVVLAGLPISEVDVFDPAAGVFSCSLWSKITPTIVPLPGNSCPSAITTTTTPGCPPGGYLATVAYDSSRNVFLMYYANSSTYTGTVAQTWRFDPVTNTWTQLDVSGGFTYTDGGKSSHFLAYDATADAYVLTQSIAAAGKINVWTLPAAATVTVVIPESMRIRGVTTRR